MNVETSPQQLQAQWMSAEPVVQDAENVLAFSGVVRCHPEGQASQDRWHVVFGKEIDVTHVELNRTQNGTVEKNGKISAAYKTGYSSAKQRRFVMASVKPGGPDSMMQSLTLPADIIEELNLEVGALVKGTLAHHGGRSASIQSIEVVDSIFTPTAELTSGPEGERTGDHILLRHASQSAARPDEHRLVIGNQFEAVPEMESKP